MTSKYARRRRLWPKKATSSDGYLLKLYIAGMSSRSIAAIRSIRRICDEHLQDRHVLEIVDLYRHPARAREEQIVAAPTLIKKLPPPQRRIIGNMSDESRLIAGLDVRKK